ncbi:hypothetical protein SDJN02_13778, partial [Cucurbita argyrosperma subsp. argyrosperma]
MDDTSHVADFVNVLVAVQVVYERTCCRNQLMNYSNGCNSLTRTDHALDPSGPKSNDCYRDRSS